MKISLMDLSVISIKDFQTITGKKLNFIERFGFKITQKKLRNSINSNGALNTKKFERFASNDGSGFNFSLGGFALGLFLGPLGVLIAYGENKGKDHKRLWAWIGCAIWVSFVISLLEAMI